MKIKILSILVVIISLFSCEKEENNTIQVQSIKIEPQSLVMTVGDTKDLTYTTTPEKVTTTDFVWTSTNSSVVTVEEGKITAVTPGDAFVEVEADGIKGICQVTVKKKIIQVESITLDKTEITLIVGETDDVVATCLPENADDKSIFWSSSDASIATIDKTGHITAVKEGNVILHAENSNGVKADVNLTVDYIAIESLEFDPVITEMGIKEQKLFKVTVTPKNATYANQVEVHVTDQAVLSMSYYNGDGYVYSNTTGTCDLIARDNHDKIEIKTTIVAKNISDFNNLYKISPEKTINITEFFDVAEDGTMTRNDIGAFIYIAHKSSYSPEYIKITSSDNTKIGFIDYEEGSLTAGTYVTLDLKDVKEGDVITIHSETEDGNYESDCEVKIINDENHFATGYFTLPFADKGITLTTGNTHQLSVNVRGTFSNPKFHYFSFNPKVATVDENGLITATGAGRTTVLSISEDTGAILSSSVNIN